MNLQKKCVFIYHYDFILLSFLAFYQFGLIFYRKRGNVKEWIDVKNNFWKLNLKISIHCIFPEIQVIIQDFVIEMVSWIFNWIFLTKSIECLNKLGLSCAKLIFLWVHLPVRLSSCEVIFLWARLPASLSSSKVVFQ